MIFIGYEYDNKDIKWKKIYWFNGDETKYSISNIGLVRNDERNKIMKTNFDKGYERLNLTHKGKSKQFFVHRLIATYFIPNPEHKPEVNHKDLNRHNNYDYNLEWVTHEENQQWNYKIPGYKRQSVSNKKLSKIQIKLICELLMENKLTIVQIAKITNTSRQAVSRILKGECHTDISYKYDLSKYTFDKDFSKYGDNNIKTKYSDEKIKNICELIDTEKKSLKEISILTSVDFQTVRNVYYGTCRKNISKNYNFMKTNKNILFENKKNLVISVCKLLDSGYNSKEVSDELNCSRSFVRNILSGNTWIDISINYNFMKNKKVTK